MVCQARVKCSSVFRAYAGHLAVTLISAEDDGAAAQGWQDGRSRAYQAWKWSHQDNTLKEDVPEYGRNAGKEGKAGQNSEPCTSSSSESGL